MYTYIHCIAEQNSQDMEATQIYNKVLMDKEVVDTIKYYTTLKISNKAIFCKFDGFGG